MSSSVAAVEMKAETPSKQEIIRLRQEYISPSLSVHYSSVHPLHIVRSEGVFLYEEDGRAYLDCINNVAQVGHCHPRIVKTAQEQMQRLDSTPFLSDSYYVRHLLKHFEDPLDSVLFTTSGSEANDLALRICEHITGGSEVVVLDGAYHGHTHPLMGLSSYKAKQQRTKAIRRNMKAWMCSLPDLYRGCHSGADASNLYVKDVADVLAQIKSQGKQVACFLVEGMPSVAGQIELPPQYLAQVFKLVRAAGGLCVVDEVQTGFGRAGSHFWMYQCHDVIPDLVSIGKPMGNGHPISGVVLPSAMADSYLKFEIDTFNCHQHLYRSDPVSIAVADSVLSVIEDEKLQENARIVGDYLKEKLSLLKNDYTIIGEVRGRGLFLGIELVKDPLSKHPDPDLCTKLTHRMLMEHAILVKEDGMDNNVLKIKPPMVFSKENADTLLHALQESLSHFVPLA